MIFIDYISTIGKNPISPESINKVQEYATKLISVCRNRYLKVLTMKYPQRIKGPQ